MTAAVLGIALLVYLAYETRRPDPAVGAGAPAVSAPAASSGAPVSVMRALMGTEFKVTVWAAPGGEPAAAEAAREVLDGVASLEAEISSWRPDSQTSAVNAAAGNAALPVGEALLALVAESLAWARRTDGAFDPTGGPLFALWEEARDRGEVPTELLIHARRSLVGHDKVEVVDGGVRLQIPGMRLGFGAIGKGFAADRAAARLRELGHRDFIVDAGGDLVVGGTRGGDPWDIGVRHPRRDAFLALVSDSEFAMATSGDYEKYFVSDGVRHSHIIDPRTGRPAREIVSATVFAARGADADALATAATVLGVKAGMALVDSLPGMDALLVDEAGKVHVSKGLDKQGETLKWHAHTTE